jgi:hypothetical protein
MDTCCEKSEKYTLELCIRYKMSNIRATRAVFSLLRAAVKEAKAVAHLKMLSNEQLFLAS